MKLKICTLLLTLVSILYAQETPDGWKSLHAINLRSHALTYTPDSRIIIAAGCTWCLHLINSRSGDIIKKIDTGHGSSISSLALTDDGATLATGSYDSCIKLWDLENLDNPQHTLKDHSDWIRSLAWQEEKKLLASASVDRTIILRDLRNPQEIVARLEGHTADVRAVTFQHDGTALITGSVDTTIKRWDLRNLRQAQQLIGHQSPVRSLKVNREDILASAANDGTIQLQDLNQPSELYGKFEHSHVEEVPCLSFDQPDGQLLASAFHKSVYVWDLQTKQLAYKLKFKDYAETVSFSPDGTQLAVCTDTITLWRHPDTATCE